MGETITHQKAKGIIAAHHTDLETPEAEEEIHSLFNPEVTPPEEDNNDQSFNYKRDNKANQKGDIYEPQGYDACQTPPYAVEPLLGNLLGNWTIWEPARGEGYLEASLQDGGLNVVSSDILTDQNFFDYEPDDWDCLVTNPPFSIKYKWLDRCYKLGKPFALLLPVETLGAKTAQELFAEHDIEVIFLNKRVNFKMPNKGWHSSAQFPVAWFTWRLGIGQQMTFAKIERYGDQSFNLDAPIPEGDES
jgi:hypothetical protein